MKRSEPTDWNPEDWDGLTEEEAFAEDPGEVLDQRGTLIADQSRRSGSWSCVYAYNGLFYSWGEAEWTAWDTASEAFAAATIGDTFFDEIIDIKVAPEYRHLLADDDAVSST